ncbi:hypothetical protein P9112_003175 [Eukaryota sp. TZLM1-RC]
MSPVTWKEVKASNGKIYYYNKNTRESTWNIPCDWKEAYSNGKPYYYHIKTRETTWNPPSAYIESFSVPTTVEIVERVVRPARPLDLTAVEAILATHKKHTEYEPHEATKTFRKMLEDHGVGSSWTLKQVMRACARDERWSCLERFAFKKDLIKDYQQNRKLQENQFKYNQEKTQVETYKSIVNKVVLELYNVEGVDHHYSRDFFIYLASIIDKIIPSNSFNSLSSSQKASIVGDCCERIVQRHRKEEFRWKRSKEDEVYNSLKNHPSFLHNLSWKYCHDLLIRQCKQSGLGTESMLSVWKRLLDSFVKKQIEIKQSKVMGDIFLSRQIREGFRELLRECAQKGIFHLGMKFSDLSSIRTVTDDARWLKMSRAVYGSPAADLFRDYLVHLDENASLNTTKLIRLGVISESYLSNGIPNFEKFKELVQTSINDGVISLAPYEITLVFEYINREALANKPEIKEELNSYVLEEGEEPEEVPLKKPRIEDF